MKAAAHQSRCVSRRDFLRWSAAIGAGGLPLLAQACAPPAPSAATSAPTPTAAASALKLSVYVPFNGARAELPPTPEGVPAGYLSFPQNPVKSVSQPPGKGGEVSIMGWTVQPPPPPVEQNPAWQEMNKQLNVNLKVAFVSLNDYLPQVSTVVARGNLSDAMVLSINGSSLQGLPDFEWWPTVLVLGGSARTRASNSSFEQSRSIGSACGCK